MDMKKIVERKKRVFIIILAVIICVGIILSVFLFNLFRIIEDEKTYTVNFYSENNEIIKTETVKSGKAALQPEELDVSDGKIFKKWNTDFSSVRNNRNTFCTAVGIWIAFNWIEVCAIDGWNQPDMRPAFCKEKITLLWRIGASIIIWNIEILWTSSSTCRILQNRFRNVSLSGAPTDKHCAPRLIRKTVPWAVFCIIVVSLTVSELRFCHFYNILTLISRIRISILIIIIAKPNNN